MYDDLLINPYAKAEIVYAYGRAINAPEERFVRSTQQTTDGTFRLTCNSDGTMNIHRYGSRRENEYVLGIMCRGESLQRIAVDKRQVRVLYNYWLTVDGLMQRRQDDELMENVEALEEELANKPKIELRLKECNEMQRVDLRFAKQWVTLTFFKQVLINVRMNGDFFSRQLWFICADTRRRPLEFSRGFRRNENDMDEDTNSEESEGEVQIGRRQVSRASSTRGSQQDTASMPRSTRGPPPVEEIENTDAIRMPLNRTLGNASTEMAQSASRIGNLYQIGQYTPPRRVDLPVTMPLLSQPRQPLAMTLPSQSQQTNVPRFVQPTNVPQIDMASTANNPPSTTTTAMPPSGNAEREGAMNTEEQKSVKSKKSKFSAKSVQKAFLQAIASINFESDDSDDNE